MAAPVERQKVCQGKHGKGWGWGQGVKSSTKEIAFNPHIEPVQTLCTQERTFKPSGKGVRIK